MLSFSRSTLCVAAAFASAACVSPTADTAPAAIGSAAPPLHPVTAQTDLALDDERAVMRLPHIDLSFQIDPAARTITGTARYRVEVSEAVDRLVFDLDPRYAIRAVELDGFPLPADAYASADGKLAITLPRPLPGGYSAEVTIAWHGAPHVAVNAPWDGGIVWSATPAGEPWIATAIQGEGCDMFWPCIDHSSHRSETIATRITVPTGLVAAGNGRLVEEAVNADGTTTWHWLARDPNTYGIALQIGPYEVARRDYASRYGTTIPLEFYHLPGNAEGAERLLGELANQIMFMEERFGPYPYGDEKAGVAETPHLGMEHQTINAYGNRYRAEPYGHDWLLQHEFAHEWFANQLTHASINHMWLHEGITTWTQPLYLEWARGRMFYEAEMWRQRQRIVSRVPLVPPEGTLPDYNDRAAGWGSDIYAKGAWIMHTLRYLVTDEVLFPAITELAYGTDNPAPGNLAPVSRTTDDFQRILEARSGMALDWFFDAYFYSAELPRLISVRSDGALRLEWQTGSDLPFAMPVEIEVDGERMIAEMTGGVTVIPLPRSAAHIRIDPDNAILMHDENVARWQAAQRSARP